MPRPGRPKGPEPSLRTQWLGEQLRELRKDCGVTQDDAAEYLQRTAPVLSRYESGEYPIRRGDVLALLTLYGVSDETVRDGLLQLCDDIWRKNWWDPHRDDFGKDFINVPWLESRAVRVCEYQNMVLHGLLQTRSYAEAVITEAERGSASQAQISRWVELRMERQKILNLSDPIAYLAVLEEPVLRRPIGGVAIMREQLGHLLDMGRRANLDIRVMPTSHGPHSGHLGSFTLFEMPQPFPNVAYVETLGGSLYVESPGVDRFENAWEHLYKDALDAERSAALIRTVLKEIT